MSVSIGSGVPADIAVELLGERHSTLVPIAVAAGGTVVSVECNCTPRKFEGFGFHEFSFDVVRLSMTDVFAIQNRQVARKVMPKGGAYLVLNIVLASYAQLIRTVRPEFIYRCSAFTGLQDPPLRKHRSISEALQTGGYQLLESGRDKSGRSYWLHSRAVSRVPALFETAGGRGSTQASEAVKTPVARFFSDNVHGEMRLLGTAAAAKHKERVKVALQTYAPVERERQRPAA